MASRYSGQPAGPQEQAKLSEAVSVSNGQITSIMTLEDMKKALGLSLNGTGRIHGRQFPVGSWYHSEPVLSPSPTSSIY